MARPILPDRVRRIMLVLLLALAIAASLLVFPNAFLWKIACWLVLASAQIARRGSCWWPLAICVAIVLVKRPDWSPGMLALAAALIGSAIILFWLRAATKSEGPRSKASWIVIGVVWLFWLAAVWKSHEGMHRQRRLAFDPQRPIVCLGDSLTTGLADKEAYPQYLQELVSVPVLDWGRAGVTARDMTKHLPEILEGQPQAVVIELGGHDFLRGYGRTAAKASLVTIIKACQSADAAVVLIEIPRGFIVDPFAGLERELAREYDLELIPDSAIRMLVVRSPAIPLVGNLATPHWSDDGLHPNVSGAHMLAEIVFRSLSQMVGPSLSARPIETPPAGS